MRYRNRVLGMLCLLLVITYLDRVCISVAGPRMQASLGIGPIGWGWVTGIFTISYAGFEIPAGVLGDRIGARKVLTRIVLWWSAFTSLTGMMTAFGPLLAVRFLFGAGEAGAYPCASVVVSRWFPLRERGRAFGVILMSAQVGGALAPLLVVPMQARYGWRVSFYLFGVLGLVWAAAWYGWFRDTPAEKHGVTAQELREIGDVPRAAHPTLPWAVAVRSQNFWTILLVALCYVYTFYFFQSWFHTYLVKARGFGEGELLLSALPFVLAGAANLAGGLVSNWLVRRVGLRWGRSLIGAVSLAVSGGCAVGLMATQWAGSGDGVAECDVCGHYVSAADHVCGCAWMWGGEFAGGDGGGDERDVAGGVVCVIAGVWISGAPVWEL